MVAIIVLEHRAILACYLNFVVGLKKLGMHALKRVNPGAVKSRGTSVRRRQILLSLPVSTPDQTFPQVTDT